MSEMLRRASTIHRSTDTRMVEGDARVYVQKNPSEPFTKIEWSALADERRRAHAHDRG